MTDIKKLINLSDNFNGEVKKLMLDELEVFFWKTKWEIGNSISKANNNNMHISQDREYNLLKYFIIIFKLK